MTGTIFNIMRFAVNDGPGIRTTVFLKGVLWHVPGVITPRVFRGCMRLRTGRSGVHVCGACVDACPEHALSGPAPALSGRCKLCVACGTCAGTCVNGAREEMGREITVDELLAELVKDRVFYDESGGGVTFSGRRAADAIRFSHGRALRLSGGGITHGGRDDRVCVGRKGACPGAAH